MYTQKEAKAINAERRERRQNNPVHKYLKRVKKPVFKTTVNKSGLMSEYLKG